MRVDHDEAKSAFLAELDVWLGFTPQLSDTQLLAATRCQGWVAADVIAHVHVGLQEMVLGFLAPMTGSPDCDAATYWRGASAPGEPPFDEMDALRFVQRLAAAYRRPTGATGHFRVTATALRTAAGVLPPGVVRSEGRALATGDFLSVWTVELAVHHLDLQRELDIPRPAAAATRLARATVEALAGGVLPAAWPDETAVLLGTGRLPLDGQRRSEAGPLASRLPVLT